MSRRRALRRCRNQWHTRRRSLALCTSRCIIPWPGYLSLHRANTRNKSTIQLRCHICSILVTPDTDKSIAIPCILHAATSHQLYVLENPASGSQLRSQNRNCAAVVDILQKNSRHDSPLAWSFHGLGLKGLGLGLGCVGYIVCGLD